MPDDTPPIRDPAHDAPSSPGAGASSVQRATDAFLRFELSERLLLVGSSLTFLLGLCSWYSLRSIAGGMSFNGFAASGVTFGVTSLATVALLAVPTLQRAVLGELSRKNAQLVLFGLAAATLVLGPLRMLLTGGAGGLPSIPAGMSEAVSGGRTPWFWLALAAAGTALGGAYAGLREALDPAGGDR